MAKYQVGKHKRGGWLSALMALVIVACGETTSPDNGSETHFLFRCSESCDQGFECLSGACTENCEADADCSELDQAAVCADPGEGCRVFCDSDADCSARNESWECEAGQCISTKPPIDSPSALECPLFEGGVQDPAERATTQDAIPSSDDVALAVADDTGVFWQVRDSGDVRAFVGSGSESVLLTPRTLDQTVTAMGILTDETTVYFADAGPSPMSPPAEPGPPPPPGRLYAVPKAGGPVQLLLELDDALITPLSVTAEGVVIESDGRLYVVTDEGAELLEHIPPLSPSQGLQVADGRVYWSDWSSLREPTELFAVDLAGGEPEVVTEINGSFIVGHGRVLWKTETVVEDPLVLVEELFMFDLDTGCVTELPSRGESMGSTLMLDARHVYWKSFNALGSSEDACNTPPTPLTRVNLTTGSLEELPVEGFDVTVCTDLMAQSDDKLYMRNWQAQSLVAIDKP